MYVAHQKQKIFNDWMFVTWLISCTIVTEYNLKQWNAISMSKNNSLPLRSPYTFLRKIRGNNLLWRKYQLVLIGILWYGMHVPGCACVHLWRGEMQHNVGMTSKIWLIPVYQTQLLHSLRTWNRQAKISHNCAHVWDEVMKKVPVVSSYLNASYDIITSAISAACTTGVDSPTIQLQH